MEVSFESDRGERRQSQDQGLRTPLPGNRIGVHPTVVSQVTAAVGAGIGIQDLFVPTFTWGADTIEMSRDRGGVHGDHDR